jgi:hypothetical protein
VKRREFITLTGGAAAAWPLAARAQQAGRIRRIGVLFGVSASDQEYRQRFDALKQALRELGWADPNISFEPRFAEGKLDRLPALAAELVNLRVDSSPQSYEHDPHRYGSNWRRRRRRSSVKLGAARRQRDWPYAGRNRARHKETRAN